LGNLVRFCLLPGNRHDTVGVARLIENIHFSAMIADKAFDCDWIIEEMNKRKAKMLFHKDHSASNLLKWIEKCQMATFMFNICATLINTK